MASLVEYLAQAQTIQEELRHVIFGIAFLAFMVYEFAAFFRFLWKKWRRG